MRGDNVAGKMGYYTGFFVATLPFAWLYQKNVVSLQRLKDIKSYNNIYYLQTFLQSTGQKREGNLLFFAFFMIFRVKNLDI